MLASKRDPVIDIGALRRAATRLPRASLRLYEGRGHELLRESDRVRIPVLDAIDAFLDRAEAVDDGRASADDSICNGSPR
jgi:alpha-beta hydrolase superfamily lysophospholipase